MSRGVMPASHSSGLGDALRNPAAAPLRGLFGVVWTIHRARKTGDASEKGLRSRPRADLPPGQKPLERPRIAPETADYRYARRTFPVTEIPCVTRKRCGTSDRGHKEVAP